MSIELSLTPTILRFLLALLVTHQLATCEETPWATGPKFQQELRKPAGLIWSELPLHVAVTSLQRNRGLPVWLDRRCDPSQKLTMSSPKPLGDSFAELSETMDTLDIAWSEQVLYFGPPAAANRWATTHYKHREMLTQLRPAQRRRWNNKKPWTWVRLTDPRQLLDQLQSEWGSPFQGRDQVTHDLWAAREYPPLPLFVRLELLLSGFDLTYTFDKRGNPRIRPMPQRPRIQRAVAIGPDGRTAFDEILTRAPEARLSAGGETLIASWATHEKLRRLDDTAKTQRQPPAASLRYTLQAQNKPLGPLLRQLCQQLQLECEFHKNAQINDRTMVSFTVEQATLDELLLAVLRPVGLRYKLQARKLTVFANAD